MPFSHVASCLSQSAAQHVETHMMSQLSPNTNRSLVALADDSGHVTVLDPTKDFAVLWKFPNSTEKVHPRAAIPYLHSGRRLSARQLSSRPSSAPYVRTQPH